MPKCSHVAGGGGQAQRPAIEYAWVSLLLKLMSPSVPVKHAYYESPSGEVVVEVVVDQRQFNAAASMPHACASMAAGADEPRPGAA